MKHILIALILAGSACAGDPPVEPERALVITLKWEGDTVSVDKVDKKEVPLPVQKGFPQLLKVFFELRDKNGDVHYSGTLRDPRVIPHSDERKESGTSILTVPDIEDARKLVVLSRDPDKGLTTVMEADL